MEIKGERIQNRQKYSTAVRIINMQKNSMASEDLRQKGWCHSDGMLSGCSTGKY